MRGSAPQTPRDIIPFGKASSFVNPAASEYAGAVRIIENAGLAWRYPFFGSQQFDGGGGIGQRTQYRVGRGACGAYPYRDGPLAFRGQGGVSEPVDFPDGHCARGEHGFRPHDYPRAVCIQFYNIERLTEPTDTQAAPLADGIVYHAVMSREDTALGI